MAKLIYIINTSLDGYIEDEAGDFGWVDPEEVHECVTELLRPVGAQLLGRRMYETMAYWEAPPADLPPGHLDFAQVWQKTEKVVYSRTLTAATTRNTRVEREFDGEAIRKLKRESKQDIVIGGPELAGLALQAELVDECQLFINPVVVGSGKPAFPAKLRCDLELLENERFRTGVVHVHYRVLGVPKH